MLCHKICTFGANAVFKIVGGTLVVLAALFAGKVQADNFDRRVEIINKTGYTMTEFYASVVDIGVWEEDIFGYDVLPSGHSLIINIDDGTGYCRYDFRAVFEYGEQLFESGVNVCEISYFTYH